ncbi:MAG: S9 family peptidase [Flavobacteriales bacterium]|nr:S9 family peptidase [Flavobacteriales bacterium]MCB9178729.1 S9 family peptidase [Flavobacteriales bacterium]
MLIFGPLAPMIRPLPLLVTLLVAGCQHATTPMKTALLAPPQAAKRPFEISAHGHVRNDEYHWLRLSEEQRTAERPDARTQEVIAHLEAENAYCDSVLAPVRGLREELFKELKARIKETDLSVPYRENGYWYHHRFEEGKEYAIQVRRKDEPGALEQDFLDENEQAKGTTYYDLGDLEISPRNNIVCFSEDRVGRRQYELRFRDLNTGKDLPDVITNTGGGCAWADERTVFYPRKDETLRTYRIYRHEMGTPETADVLVYEEKDPAFSCEVYRSRSDRFVIITTESTTSSEHLTLPVEEPNGSFTPFLPREEDHEHTVIHVPGDPGKWYIVTNWEALNFRLMECAEGATADKRNWKEVVAHREEVLLEDVDAFRDHLVLSERREGLTHLVVRRLSDGREHEIAFNDAAYVCYTGTNPEWDTDRLRYGYTSLTTPNSVYEHDLNAATDRLLKQQEVVGSFDAKNYTSERIWVPAGDGEKVPVSVVYRKGTRLDGSAPLLLYGYGSYGISVEPMFSSSRLSLLDRGFVYAIAHIRGGEELGREWYESGKMEDKMNTFTDFIACADHLVAKKYADPGRVHAWGGSAGGLLMGAVVNMRPDRWNGVIADVPFVDVVTTMLDESIPLTTGEFEEWGDPKEKEAYARMLSYSPYDNVRDQKYPAMLVGTGFHDSQVQYWEPAKWVLRLREHQQGDAPILLHVNMEAGHGGASGRFEALRDVARNYAFLLWCAGLNK